MKLNDILKEQQRIWNDRIAREKIIRDWKERQKAKFNRSLIEMMHEPKSLEKNI